jgi:hypothetical protein
MLEVIMMLNVQIVVFWVMTLCSLISGFQRFGGSFRLPLSGVRDVGGSGYLRNIEKNFRNYTLSYPEEHNLLLR